VTSQFPLSKDKKNRTIVCNDDDWDKLEKAAAEKGVPVSQFVLGS
jgi:uncharacterized protein (DUF1778 family)